MKKFVVLIVALLVALFIVGCASNAPTGPSASELMASAKSNAPDGTLIGQGLATGSAKERDATLRKSEQSARLALVKGMVSIVRDLIDESVTAGRLSASVSDEFRQIVTGLLGRSALNSAVKQDQGFGAGDTAWTVYYMEKGEVLKEINNAVNLAKKEVAAANFNTNSFDAKYAAAIAREWK